VHVIVLYVDDTLSSLDTFAFCLVPRQLHTMKVPAPILRLRSFLAKLCIGRKQYADPEACTLATSVPTCPILGDDTPIPLKETASPIEIHGHLITPGTTSIICRTVRTSP